MQKIPGGFGDFGIFGIFGVFGNFLEFVWFFLASLAQSSRVPLDFTLTSHMPQPMPFYRSYGFEKTACI